MSARHPRTKRRGVVLVLVLMILILVVALALALAREVSVEVSVAQQRADQVRLRVMADSAIERAMAELRLDQTPEADTLFDTWRDNEIEFAAAEFEGGRVWLLVREPDPGDGVELRYGLRDEASKLDLNVASKEQLAALPGITDEAVDGILDWRDGDDDPEELGAESTYYNALEVPYNAKNAPFESLGELLRVKGIDDAMLYGEDRNRNGVLDPGEDDGDGSFPPDDADGELDRGLVDYLTVFSREFNRTADNRARLAWESTDANALQARLSEAGASNGLTNRVRQLKQSGQQLSSMGELIIRAQATDPEQAALLIEHVTFVDGDTVPGRINVNTAPREVLAGLPGLTEDEVEAILTQRIDPSADLSSPAWLMELLPFGTFLGLVDQVCTRSYQFQIDVVALLDDRPRFKRLEVLVDRSFAPVRILLWRDVTALGFPLAGERGEDLP